VLIPAGAVAAVLRERAVIAGKIGVVHGRAGQRGAAKTQTEFDALDRVERQERFADPSVEPPVPLRVRTQADRQTAGDHFEDAAQRVAGLARGIDLLHDALGSVRIEHADGRRVDPFVQRRDVRIEGRFIDDLADSYHAAGDRDAEFRQQPPRDRTERDAHRRFARAGALEDVAHVGSVVLQPADPVGVSGPGNVDRPRRFARARLDRHDIEPLLMIAILDVQRDRAADRFAAAHAREDLDLVGLDLHPVSAPVAHLAPQRIGVDVLDRERHAGRHALHDPGQGGPVRFAGGEIP